MVFRVDEHGKRIPGREAQDTTTLKLSLVTETFPPEINGVSMTLGRLVDGLQQRNVRMTVIAPDRRDRPANQQGGYNLLAVPGFPLPRYSELKFGLPANNRLRTLWTNERPDLVHIATEGPLGWSARQIARELELPVVSSFHTNFHAYGNHYGFGFLKTAVLGWLRSFHNHTLRTFVPSTDLINKLAQEGFRNLRLFARGVDTVLYGPEHRSSGLRASWGADDETPVAIYVGRLAGEKNLELVVEAYQRMKRDLPQLRIVFVGDGPDRVKLERLIPEACFAGMQRGTDLAAHYASADVFLFGSITETFGNVVTEAMASGLVVLAYGYAAAGRFIRTGENGLLAPFDDPAAFLDQASHLATLRRKWPEMGRAARETMLPHSWDTIIDKYLQELQSLLVRSA